MTVEDYLRSLVPGLDLDSNVIARAARSPKEVSLEALEMDDDIDDYDDDPTFQIRLDYASSTVYYSVLGVFSGGGYTEQVGDVKVVRSSYTVTKDDRDRFRLLADALRRKHGFDVESADDGGIYDATYLRRRV